LGGQQLEILDLREEIESTLEDLSDSIIETKAEINIEVAVTNARSKSNKKTDALLSRLD
jgi:hypothetical protein